MKLIFKMLKDPIKSIDSLKKNSIVIISDNLSFYLMDLKNEKKIYKELIGKLQKKWAGYNIFIKPHPNEIQNLQKFDFVEDNFLITQDISMEELINNNSIDLVAGFCSTALLTSSQILNKDTISLVNELNDVYLNEYGKKRINNFRRLTYNLKRIEFKI
jgi:hypothetical protein